MKLTSLVVTGFLVVLLFSSNALAQTPPSLNVQPSAEPIAQAPRHKEGFKSIETTNPTNKTFKYYYYLPASVIDNPKRSHNVMVLVPGFGNTEKEVATAQMKSFADQHGLIIITPLFKFSDADLQKHISYQYPSAWSGQALLDILTKFNRAGIRTGQLYMFGISAGAQYTLRFALWDSTKVRACVGHAPGGSIVPTKKVGAKIFNTIGSNDAAFRMKVHEDFLKKAKEFGLNVKSKIYPGLGHSMSPELTTDTIQFFKANM